jgi:hypothetical protein
MPLVLDPEVDAASDNPFQSEALARERLGRGRSRANALTHRVEIPGTPDEPEALRDILHSVLAQRGIHISA